MAKLTPAQLKWKAHVDAAKAAGQTLTDYAREHTLNVQTLYSHSRKVNKPGKSSAKSRSAFVRVAAATSVTAAVRIELPNGVRVSVSSPIDLPSLLSHVARLP